MSKSEKLPLENAEEIIEKFGGIRPMAAKTGVAVTTIQGWKKRGVIPGARMESILEAASEHDVDLSGLVDGAASLETADEEPEQKFGEVIAESEDDESLEEAKDDAEEEEDEDEEEEVKAEKQEAFEEDKDDDEDSREDNDEDDDEGSEDDDLDIPAALKRTAVAEGGKEKLRANRMSGAEYMEFTLEGKKGAMNRSMVIAAIIILLILAALAGLVMPKYKGTTEREARIEELERQLSAVKKEQSGFKGLVPENWSAELEQLKRQAEEVKKGVSGKVNDVKAMSQDLASAQGINSRVEQLQTYVSEISGGNGIYALKGRFEKMRQDYMGEKILSNSVQALLPVIQSSGSKNDEHVNLLIADARTQDKALQTTLGSVPQNELKAAAMLLAMTQVRSALNRPDTEFDSDLQLLFGMVDEDDVELRAAIEKLAPYSKEGVLTPAGLKNEFQGVAGEAVAASLRGEDVSVSDKLSAKFNELLKVEKDGELLTGTQTQATINTAENLVNENRFEDAVKVLKKNLHAKELEPLRPWIKKAEGMIASKKLGSMLEEAIEMNFGPGLLGGKVLEGGQY